MRWDGAQIPVIASNCAQILGKQLRESRWQSINISYQVREEALEAVCRFVEPMSFKNNMHACFPGLSIRC